MEYSWESVFLHSFDMILQLWLIIVVSTVEDIFNTLSPTVCPALLNNQ